MPASGAFKNCRTVINAQRKIRSTWRPEAAQWDSVGGRPSHWELTLSRGMGNGQCGAMGVAKVLRVTIFRVPQGKKQQIVK